MVLFFRIIGLVLLLLGLVAGALYHQGGKSKEFTAEVLIPGTDIQIVKRSLTNPEWAAQWAEDSYEVKPNNLDDRQAELVVQGDQGPVRFQNRFLHASDTSLSVQTSSESRTAVSIWKWEQSGQDVRVRQLLVGTYRGWDRLLNWFTEDALETTMQEDLDRLKTFVESKTSEASESSEAEPNESRESPQTENEGKN